MMPEPLMTSVKREILEAAVEFIAKDSDAYARALAQLVVGAAESLTEFPTRGHRLRNPHR
jgi:hypothetical protein